MAGYIGIQPTPQATQTRDTFTATSNQTSFPTSGYTPEFLDVFMNGVHLLNGTDYTASNGSDVVLAVGATTGDIIEVVAYSTFTMTDQTFTGTTTMGATLRAPATFTIDPAVHGANSGTVVIAGDLTVNGTTTTINSTTISSADKNITLGAGGTASANDGAGITIDGASASLTYVHSGTKFLFNKDLHITGGVNPTNNLELNTNYRVRWNDSNDYSIMSDSANYIRTYVGGAQILSAESTGITVTGEIDASTLLKVGTNNTEYANNYIRFKPAGAAYIDHNTVGQDINFRTSVSSSLDTTPFVIKSGGNLKAETKLGIGIDPVEMLDIQSASGDARIRLDAPSGSDTEIKFFNAGSAQYTIGHDDATDNFVIGGVNVDAPLVSVSKAGIVKIASTGGLNFDGGSDGNANIDYHIGGNYMKFVTNSTSASMRFHTSSSTDPRMIILANGNVGIGTDSPSVTLEVIDPVSGNFAGAITVGGTGSSRRLILEQTDVLTYRVGATGASTITQLVSAGSSGVGSVGLTLDASSNVGIGRTSALGAKLDIKQSTNGDTDGIIVRPLNETQTMVYSFLGPSTTYFAQYEADSGASGSGSNNYHTFSVGGTATANELLRLGGGGTIFNDGGLDRDFRVESDTNENALFVDASANVVYIGKNTGALADVGYYFNANTGNTELTGDGSADTLRINRKNSAGTVVNFWLDTLSKGSITIQSNGVTYLTTSDRRLKKDIETITDGTDKLMAMNPVTHGWKADPEADTVHGFIAQEIMEIIPEAVSGDPEGKEMMSMDYGRITPVIVAALQDALKEIKELKTRINKLENK
jgi:hypothetical protein